MTDYVLSRGIVEAVRDQQNTNKYFIRIIPDMESIEEVKLLPEFPSFFKNHVETYTRGNVIWALHTKDFQVGYVLGLCESSEGQNLTPLLEKIHELQRKHGLPISNIQNISFHIIDESFIDFSDKETSISGRFSNTGASVIYGKDGSILINSFLAKLHMDEKGNLSIEDINETHTVDKTYSVEANSIIENVSKREVNVTENNKELISGDSSKTVVGNNQEAYTRDSSVVYLSKKKETVGMGESKMIVTGGQDTTVIAGNYIIKTVAGKVQILSGGGLNIIAGPGGLNIVSAGTISLTTPNLDINALSVNLKTFGIKAPNGFTAPTGSGPFCALPVCLFTGAPHIGNVFAGSGG